RGIELPRSTVETTLSEGRAAFFFDGLDEVGYIDKRIALLSEIDSLVKTFASRGNRFVLASRPAAIQPVDIPEAMTYLQLKGLTHEEIRILAGRVLTARLSEHEEKNLTEEEKDLIERLLEDTRTSPGIARIARNPLLLTLLDRKSTRLNSSHVAISYAVFCLKKKNHHEHTREAKCLLRPQAPPAS